jgi:hypothetical protein
VYTDVSCDHVNRVAAIAGYYGEEHPLNFAFILREYRGNSAAETIAVRVALERIKN